MNQDSPQNQPFGAQVIQNDSKTAAVAIWIAAIAAVLGAIGLTLGIVSQSNTSAMLTAAIGLAEQAGRAAAKAETATARANVSEIYAKQVYTELNRLGYPVKTPAEDHSPQPSDNVSEEPGK